MSILMINNNDEDEETADGGLMITHKQGTNQFNASLYI